MASPTTRAAEGTRTAAVPAPPAVLVVCVMSLSAERAAVPAAPVEPTDPAPSECAERGWIAGAPPVLTDAGREARDRLEVQVRALRERVAGSVSAEDFATTLRSLEAIARELGWDESESIPRGHRGGRRHGFGGWHGAGKEHGFGRHPGFGPQPSRQDVHVHVHLHDDDRHPDDRHHGGGHRHHGRPHTGA